MRRPWLLPLVPLYAAGLRRAQRRAEAAARELAWPVVSVGSLSAGGAGKTPVVVALARLLMREGYGVDVLSRGYRRGSNAVERVDAAGDAQRYGDEPMLLARGGVAVFVGADRYAAGLRAEREGSAAMVGAGGRRVHLLDDGFQHRRLRRAVDVVLLTQKDAEDWLLPAGDLREPLAGLAQADAVVVRAEEAEDLLPVVRRFARAGAPVWTIRRRLRLEEPVRGRVLAFCGVARPEGFFGMLREAGCEVAETMSFRDHHRYRERDMDRLVQAARRVRAEGFCTTEKDAVKLTEAMRRRLREVGPVQVAGLEVKFEEEAMVLEWLRASLTSRKMVFFKG